MTNALHAHSKYDKLKVECELYPEHAEQLFQVYLDLTEAKQFKDVSVIPSTTLQQCFIEGTHPDTGGYHLVLPILASASWTTRYMAHVFESIAQEQDERLRRASDKTITLGIISQDSTVTYVNLHRGIVRSTG
ncbi:hypothetical protein BGW42_001814 [Actinomortierella wolfii]|nr:hypothetical protein BGW42_001814 [Actinomortierella wolfii]